MQRHRLCSPNNTFYVIPTVALVNGQKNVRNSLDLRNPVIFGNLTENPQGEATALINKCGANSNLQGPSKMSGGKPSLPKVQQAQQKRPNPSTSVSAPVEPKSHGDDLRRRNEIRVVSCTSTKNMDYVPESSSDSDSSSTGLVVAHGFFESLRLPYSAKEDEEILEFVLIDGNIAKTTSLSLWRELETKKKDPKRTYQSLKNRFLRNIKPHLLTRFRHMLSEDDIAQFKIKFPELKTSRRYREFEIRKHKLKSFESIKTNEKKNLPSALAMIEGPSSKRGETRGPHAQRTIRTFRDVAVGDDFLSLTNSTGKSAAPGAKEVEGSGAWHKDKNGALVAANNTTPVTKKDAETITDVVIMNNSDEDIAPGSTVQIFAQEKLQNMCEQTFQYSKILESFRDRANINVNLVLTTHDAESPEFSESLLSRTDLPLKVDVTVVVSSERRGTRCATAAAAAKNREDERLSTMNTTATTRRRKIPVPARNGIAKPYKKRYLLMLKKQNYKKVRTLPRTYKENLAELLIKLRAETAVREGRSSEPRTQENRETPAAECEESVVRSQSKEEPQVNSQSSITSSSTEDESCYSQVFRKVSRFHQVIVEDPRDEEESSQANREQDENSQRIREQDESSPRNRNQDESSPRNRNQDESSPRNRKPDESSQRNMEQDENSQTNWEQTDDAAGATTLASCPTDEKPKLDLLMTEYTPEKNPLLNNMLEMFDPIVKIEPLEEGPAWNLRSKTKNKT